MVVGAFLFTFVVVITISAAASRSHGIEAFKSPFVSSRALREAETAVEDHERVNASALCSGESTIPCGDSDVFVCLEEVCDGFDDCLDGSDEYGCESIGVARCAGGGSSCADGVGVVCSVQLCDGIEDCLDGSDELNCGLAAEQKCFSEYSFACTNGKGDVCLEQMCDGIEDCNDGSDELDCVSAPIPDAPESTSTPESPTPTPASEASTPNNTPTPGAPQSPLHNACVGISSFACTGGSEICTEQVCDGKHDCEDGSDEQNCDSPPAPRLSYASGVPTSSSSPASGIPASATPPVLDDLIHQSQLVASDFFTTASPSIPVASTVPSLPSASGAVTSPYYVTVFNASMLMKDSSTLASDDSNQDISSASGVSTATSSSPASVIPTSSKPSVFDEHIFKRRSMASDASTTSTLPIYVAITVPKSLFGFGALSSPSFFTAADSSIWKSRTSSGAQEESFPEFSSNESNLEYSPASAVPTTSRSFTDASILQSPSPGLGVHTNSMPQLASDDSNLETLEIASDSMPGASSTFSTTKMPSLLSVSGILPHKSPSPASNTLIPQTLSIASRVSTGSTYFASDDFLLLNTPIASDPHTQANPSSLSDDTTARTPLSASSLPILNPFHIEAVTSTAPGPFPFSDVGVSTPLMSSVASSFSRDVITNSLFPHITNPTSGSESNIFPTSSITPQASYLGGSIPPRSHLATENANSVIPSHHFDASVAPIKPNAFDSFHIPSFESGLVTLPSALTTSGTPTSSITASITTVLTLASNHTMSGASNLPTLATSDSANSFSSNPGLDGPTTPTTNPAFDPFIAPSSSPLAELSAQSSVFITTGAPNSSTQSSVYDASTSSSSSSGSEGHYSSNYHPPSGSPTRLTSPDNSDEFDHLQTLNQTQDLDAFTQASSLYSLNIPNPPIFVSSEASIPQTLPVNSNALFLQSFHHVSVASSVPSFPPVSKANTLSYPSLPFNIPSQSSFPSAAGVFATSPSLASFSPTMPSISSVSLSSLSSRIPVSSHFTLPTPSRASVVPTSTRQSIVSTITTTATLSTATNLPATPLASTQPDVATLQNLFLASDDHTSPREPLASDDRTLQNQSLSSYDHTPPNQPLASDDHTPLKEPFALDDQTPPKQPFAPDDHTGPTPPLASGFHTTPNQQLVSDEHSPSNQPPASDEYTLPKQPLASDDDFTPTKQPLASDDHAPPKQPLASGNRNVPILSPARNIPPWSIRSPLSLRRHGRPSAKSATNMASSQTARGNVCALTTTLLASGVLVVFF